MKGGGGLEPLFCEHSPAGMWGSRLQEREDSEGFAVKGQVNEIPWVYSDWLRLLE